MKFFSIRNPRNLFLIALVSSWNLLDAQTLSQSPYGRFGLGDQIYAVSPYLQSMGGISQAVADSNILNLNQPAALASLESGVTLFEAGITGSSTRYDFTNKSTQGRTAGFGYFGLAFPIIKHVWNTSISLSPISNVGYTLRDTINDVNAGDIYLNYTGEGGYSMFSWGHGLRLGKNFSLGVQGRFYFGKIDYSSGVYFADGASGGNRNTLITRTNRIGGMDVNSGLMYRKYFHARKAKLDSVGNVIRPANQDSLLLTLGVSYRPEFDLNGSYSYLAQSFFSSSPNNNPGSTDTTAFVDRSSGKIRMPLQAGGGLTLSSSSGKWLISADYMYSAWDNFSLFGASDSVRTNYRAALGIQINPVPMQKSNSGKSAYWKRIRYRFGGYYSDGMLRISGNAIPEYGLSLGFGLPIVLRTYNTRPATSVLNFAISAGRRGITGTNPLVESYVRFSVGFSLNDRWFRKLQYD